MESIYLLEGASDCMAYDYADPDLSERILFNRMSVRELGGTATPMRPSFGTAPVQPTRLADVHNVMGKARMFSSRAVEVLELAQYGDLFPLDAEGRDDRRFYMFWSTCVIDCLDHERTTWVRPGLLRDAAFDEARLGDAAIFTVPEDQSHQFHLFIRAPAVKRIKSAALTGFRIKRSRFDPKPWRS